MPKGLGPDKAEPAAALKSERGLKVAYWTVGVLAVLAIAGALWLRRIDAEHQKLLQKAREDIETLRVQPVPDEENAALDYERAFSLFSIGPRDYSTKFTSQIDQFKLDIGSVEVAKLLADDAPTLVALEQAAAKRHCVFVTDYSAGANIKIPSLLNARTACLLLSIAAKRAAHDGDYRGATEHLRQMLCLARGIGQIRMLICGMISMALEDISLQTLRDILTQTEPDPKSLQLMGEILREHTAGRTPLAESMHGEWVIGGLIAAECSVSGTPPYHKLRMPDIIFKLRRGTGGILRDARLWEDLWNRTEAAYSKPYPQALRDAQAINESRQFKELSEAKGSPYALFVLASPCRSDAELAGLLRCARLAIACRLHQTRTGKLPETLTELAGQFATDFAEVSTDPFSGKPMLYQRREPGFTVYSVGAWDPKDNGAPMPHCHIVDPDLTFPVDRKAWEDYRAKRLSKPKPPAVPHHPKPAAPPPPR